MGSRGRLGQCAGGGWGTFDVAKLMIFSQTVAFEFKTNRGVYHPVRYLIGGGGVRFKAVALA